eukprot:3504-Chlamydomonas_euryale.AAC.1
MSVLGVRWVKATCMCVCVCGVALRIVLRVLRVCRSTVYRFAMLKVQQGWAAVVWGGGLFGQRLAFSAVTVLPRSFGDLSYGDLQNTP